MRDDFAVFILSNRRPDRIQTLNPLLNVGHYTGKYYIIIDDEDPTQEEYKKNFGDKVIVFNKDFSIINTVDIGDNFPERRGVTFARNMCHQIALKLGLKYFLVLDDDYSRFYYKYIKNGHTLSEIPLRQMDRLFETFVNFLETSNALTVALAQGGDFIGGADSNMLQKGLKRKAMNTFFCRTDDPFQFTGRINEDVNTYVELGRKGKLFFTVTRVGIYQTATQQNKGGLTEIYLDVGTYVKSFYSVMYAPSCVKVQIMRGTV